MAKFRIIEENNPTHKYVVISLGLTGRHSKEGLPIENSEWRWEGGFKTIGECEAKIERLKAQNIKDNAPYTPKVIKEY